MCPYIFSLFLSLVYFLFCSIQEKRMRIDYTKKIYINGHILYLIIHIYIFLHEKLFTGNMYIHIYIYTHTYIHVYFIAFDFLSLGPTFPL